MKKTKRQILTLFLAFVMCITAVDVRAYADTTQNAVSGSEWDGVTNKSAYEGENFRVTFSLMSYWQGGFNANVRIDNIGTEIIENWSLGLDYPGTLSHVWNAEIVAGENGHYVMKNAGWNQDIPVGGSVEFGIGEQEDFCGFPTNYELIGELSDVSMDDYAAAYTLVSDWGSGFSATISISNRTEQAIEDWVLEFDFDREITDLWNGVIESHTGNHYVIRNAGYNSMIAAGAEIVVGFNGTGGRAEDEPQAYSVHQYSNGTTGDNTEVDSDGDGLSDDIEDCLGTDKNQKDTDGDGLPDNLEVETFGTDPLNPDTDVDGLPDGYEVLILGTDPLKIDSDDNGISDSDEDFDEDDLCNSDEYLNDSNPWNCDSDEDGLTDGEEVNVYGTSPINSDTDDDELTDDMELKYDMNPTNPDTLNDGILDGNRIFSITSEDISDNGDVKMFISVDLQGKNINSFTSERVSEKDYFLNSEIPGYLGNAFDFNMNGTFSKATLTYELNEKLFDSSDFVPAIYYWDEKEQFLFEVPNQTIVDNTVSVELEHFSKYVVIAKNKYEEKLFDFEILSPTNEEYKNRKFDVIFVLDESGSISYGNFYTMKNMCKNLVSTFDNNDRVSVYTFDDVIRRRSGFTDKKSAALTLSSLDQHKGWTAIYNAIYSATDEFISYSDSDATKIMIVLTDGIDYDSTYTPSEVTQRALDHNIIIYTIGIGSVNEYVLNSIASSTGGAYYSGANFSQLEGIFNKFISDFDLYKDSDRDNISDYHEKKISAGELKGGTGAPVKNFTSLDYLNSDSDGDGLIDGNELEI